MNELEKDILQPLLSNELLLLTIKKVFNLTADQEKPEIREGQNNELLGEKYRAYEEAKKIIERGFINLISYKVIRNPVEKLNKGR